MTPNPGQLLVISGPSGTGKSTICTVLKQHPGVEFSVSATTREPRRGEVDGRDYHFKTKDDFLEHIKNGDFIEHAEVHGNLYGTLREPMDDCIARGKTFLLEIDVQGALQLKELGVEGLYVFIAPPDFDTLRDRLEKRGTDAPDVIERRLKKATDEYNERHRYDHVVVNLELEPAIDEVFRIAGLERPRTEAGKDNA